MNVLEKSVLLPIIQAPSLMTEHPSLTDLELDAKNFVALAASPAGMKLARVMKSVPAVLSLVAAHDAAPSRPPVVGVLRLLEAELGDAAFTDDMKQLTGRYIRQVLEHLGYKWKRSGVTIIVKWSRHVSGSIYDAPSSK